MPDWRSIGIPHCISQTSDSNQYSQGQGDLSSDGDTQANASAFRGPLECNIPNGDALDCQPVQKPQLTLVIPHSSPLLGSSLCQSHAEHLRLTNFAHFDFHDSPVQRLDSLHWIAWQETVVIPPRLQGEHVPESEFGFLKN